MIPTAKRILIVDDEPDIREVLAISLEDMGYRTVEAENAATAFDLFQKENPQIVVTDIKMPGGDGIGLLRKIKHENTETEVIMITGHGDMDLAIRSLKYEATDFITKPINVDALEIALRRAREKIAMRRKLQEYTRSLEQLVQEKTELQDHLASLGLMIGSVSHGMKGLLTSLDGGLYLVSSGLKKKDFKRVEEGCQAAQETVQRIRKMVLDILYLCQGTATEASSGPDRRLCRRIWFGSSSPALTAAASGWRAILRAPQAPWRWMPITCRPPWSTFWKMPWTPV